MPPPRPPADPDEDEVSTPDDDLDAPPEDGDDDDLVTDEEGEEGDDDLDDLDDAGEGGDPRDDAESDAIETDDDLDPVDEHEDREGGELELDVGPLDEGIGPDDDDAEGDPEKLDDPGAEGDELDIDERDDADDGGAEGTDDDPEDQVDEAALPELDADEEGEEGDDELAQLLLGDADEATRLPWAEARWLSIDGAGAAAPVCALSIEGGRLAAAGERLLLVDEGALGARRASFGAGSTAVALTGGLLLAAGARAQLWLSEDGGERAILLPGFAQVAAPIDLAATPGRLWLRCDGALLGIRSPSLPPVIHRERDVLALTATGATIVTLRRTSEGPSLERLRGDDEGWQETPLRAPARRMIERARRPLLLAAAAGGRAVALGDGASIALSRDGGSAFELLAIEGVVALCFAGDDEAAPLLLLSTALGATPGEAALVQVLPDGAISRLTAIAGVGEAPAAMAWDRTRDRVWVACEAGLLAFARPPRH